MQSKEGNIMQYYVILSKLVKERLLCTLQHVEQIHDNIICKSESLKGLESTKDI